MTSAIVREPAATGDGHARDLLGTRAVVTGGTRGIGAAIAGTLARCGARVLVSARNRARHPEPSALDGNYRGNQPGTIGCHRATRPRRHLS